MSSGGQLSTEQRTPARAADFRAVVFICYMGVKTGPLHGMVVKSEGLMCAQLLEYAGTNSVLVRA